MRATFPTRRDTLLTVPFPPTEMYTVYASLLPSGLPDTPALRRAILRAKREKQPIVIHATFTYPPITNTIMNDNTEYGNILSNNVPRMESNIERIRCIATDAEKVEGMQWYRNARMFADSIAFEFNVETERVAHVISALSVAVDWQRNRADTLRVFRAVRDGYGPDEITVSTYGRQKMKAYRMARGESLALQGDGLKTLAFSANINRPDVAGPVTVDRHATAIALDSVGFEHLAVNLTPKRYRNVCEAYVRVADRAGILPHQMQAIVWTVYRNRFALRFAS